MSEGEKYELKILAGIFTLSLLSGLLTNYVLLTLLLGLLTYMTWHLAQLFRFGRWIRRQQSVRPPYTPGLWEEIYHSLEKARTVEQKRSKLLIRLLSRFRTAASAIPSGLVVLDQNQCIDWANPAANTLLDIDFPKAEGKHILNLLRYPFLREYIFTADFTQPMDFPSPNYSGHIVSLQIIPFTEKKSRRLLLIARDITQIYNLDQIRKDFVANVSHDLRTPLTVIVGSIENLIHYKKYPAQERPLQLVQQQATRMESIINDLLTLSRIEMDEKHRIQKLVPVPPLLHESIEEARNLSGNQNHDIQWDIDPKLGLMGNQFELRSVFSNLIFNAVKYTPPRSKIRVIWKYENQKASFIVKDSGEGIAARHLPRLTERFYRVDPGRTVQSGSTGLGLAIVKHGVSRHGGEIKIDSKIGFGSTFQCIFFEGAFCLLPDPSNDEETQQPANSRASG